MNEDGTATIMRCLDADAFSDAFQVHHTKLRQLNAAQLDQDHGQRGNEMNPLNPAADLATIFQQVLQQNAQNNNRNKGASEFAEKLFYGTQLTKFVHKFPTDENSFYRWTTAIEAYETENSGLPADMIFKRVVASLKGSTSTAWRRHRTKKYRDYVAAAEDVEDNAIVKRDYMKENVDNLTELQRFAIKEVQVAPDMSYFQTKLLQLTAFRSEKPKETLGRLEQFYFDYGILKKKLNESIPMKLRSFRVHEKFDHIKRVLITDNNKTVHNNDSILNAKVKTKMSKKVEALQKDIDDPDDEEKDEELYTELVRYIKEDLAQEILPSLDEVQHEDGKHWVKYSSRSVFTSNSPPKSKRSEFTRKRRRDGDKKSPSKRTKYSDTPRCPDGANCRYITKGKECYKQHTRQEMKAMRTAKREASKFVQRVVRNATTTSSSKPIRDRKRARYQSKHSESPSKRQKKGDESGDARGTGQSNKCRHGTNCTFWQQGICNFQHFSKEMKCASCGISGHPASACRKSKRTITSNSTPPRYNVTNPNHSKVLAMQNQNIPQFYTANYHQTVRSTPSMTPNLSPVPTSNQLTMARDELERAQMQYSTMKKAAGFQTKGYPHGHQQV